MVEISLAVLSIKCAMTASRPVYAPQAMHNIAWSEGIIYSLCSSRCPGARRSVLCHKLAKLL